MTLQAAVISLFLTLAASSEAGATTFTFTKIADTSGRYSFFQSPSINNTGRVAFVAGLDAGGEGVFTSSGGSVTTIATNSNFPISSLGPVVFSIPSINDTGRVAFTATRRTRQNNLFISLVTGNGGSLTTIANDRGAFSSFGSPSINNPGTVAFNGAQRNVGSGIFTGNGGITTIANNSGRFANFFNFSVNDSGTVAFAASLDNTKEGIFTGRGGITTIANTGGSFRYFIGASINNRGVVVFRAGLQDQTSERIVIARGGTFTTVAQSNIISGKRYLIFNSVPSINNAGKVAFEASIRGGEGIFTGPQVTDKVIASGDSLFGSRVISVGFFQEGLNDAGQITFVAQLANGTEAIVRANPQTIR